MHNILIPLSLVISHQNIFLYFLTQNVTRLRCTSSYATLYYFARIQYLRPMYFPRGFLFLNFPHISENLPYLAIFYRYFAKYFFPNSTFSINDIDTTRKIKIFFFCCSKVSIFFINEFVNLRFRRNDS